MNLWQTVPWGGLFFTGQDADYAVQSRVDAAKERLKQFGSDILLLKYQNQRRKE